MQLILDKTARASGVPQKAYRQEPGQSTSWTHMRTQPKHLNDKGGGCPLQSYLRTKFRHTDRVADDIHDVKAIPIAHTRHMIAGAQARNTSTGGHF